jgi:hypothetical protein
MLEAPGPPGLTCSEPRRLAGPVAFLRITASSMSSPLPAFA